MPRKPNHPKAIAALLLAAAALPMPALLRADQPEADLHLVVDAGFHSAAVNRVAASADGSRLLSASDDKTARVFDGSGKLLRVLRVPIGDGNAGRLYACALSPDGRAAALSGWTKTPDGDAHSVYIIDTASGGLIRRIGGLPNVVFHLAYGRTTAGGELLACSLGAGGIRVFDVQTGAETFRDEKYGGSSYGIAFSADGALLAASGYDRGVRLYRRDGAGFALVKALAGRGGKQPFAVAFGRAAGKTWLAVGFADAAAVDVYAASAENLIYGFSPDAAGLAGANLGRVAFLAKDGEGTADDRLIAGGKYGGRGQAIYVWENGGRGGRAEMRIDGIDNIMDLRPLADGGVLIALSDPKLIRLDADFQPIFALDSPIADYRGDDAWNGLRLSVDGSSVNFAYKAMGGDPASFSVTARILEAAGGFTAQDRTALPVSGWRYGYGPTLDGRDLGLPDEWCASLAIAPDKSSFLIGTTFSVHRYTADGRRLWSAPQPDTAWGVAVSGDGKLGAAALANGTIRWFRMDTGAVLLTFFPHPDRTRWVAWTPSGYYAASPGAEEFLGWQVDNGQDAAPDFYPVSRFRSAFYRPDIIALTLSSPDETTAVERANAASGRKPDSAGILAKRPPTIAIIDPVSGTTIAGASVRLSYRTDAPADAPVTGVRALVDGRPIETAKGLTVVATLSRDLYIDIPIPSGTCTVSLLADSINGSSEAASIQLTRTIPEEFIIKPKLYVLAVGVSDYANPEYRLKYAAKDARDLSAALVKQKGGIYRDVVARILVDADANKDEILDGLDWIQKETTAKDVALLYFSGHGLNDSNQNYYYLPVETDLERLKRTGVPFSDITTTIAGIAGKVLFFIDTCHSGNLMAGRKAVGTERDVAAVVNELSSAENGAIVFASSTGSQYSYEDPAWANGAFTKALIEGLSGEAAYSGNGRITINMLDLYLSERVKELTGGKQTPTTTKPANVPDFPLAMKTL